MLPATQRFVARVLAAMQEAEEIHESMSPSEYLEAMNAIEDAARDRAQNCAASIGVPAVAFCTCTIVSPLESLSIMVRPSPLCRVEAHRAAALRAERGR